MPRIRTIKPEFWSSPAWRGSDPWTRLLYIAMWNWADDLGRGSANPKELAAFAFPHDDHMTASELQRHLAEIQKRCEVVFYEVRGRLYYAIPTWDEHQKTEAKAKAKHPGPDEGFEYDPQAPALQEQTSVGTSEDSVGSSDASLGSSAPGTGEQGNRGTGSLSRPSRPRSGKTQPIGSDRFDEFWRIYPRHDGKKPAREVWDRALKRGADADKIIDGARRYAKARQGQDTAYTAMAKTWLNEARWDDEHQQPKPQSQASGHTPFQNPSDDSVYEEPLLPRRTA